MRKTTDIEILMLALSINSISSPMKPRLYQDSVDGGLQGLAAHPYTWKRKTATYLLN